MGNWSCLTAGPNRRMQLLFNRSGYRMGTAVKKRDGESSERGLESDDLG